MTLEQQIKKAREAIERNSEIVRKNTAQILINGAELTNAFDQTVDAATLSAISEGVDYARGMIAGAFAMMICSGALTDIEKLETEMKDGNNKAAD